MHAMKNLLFISDVASNDFFQGHFASNNSNPQVPEELGNIKIQSSVLFKV